ncbi:MAG: C10 family peptidase, partial [Bacteroidales bacterium]|nr:C10 family peptidase [Bacteroidales bacterium]
LMLHIGIALEMKYTIHNDTIDTPTLIEYIHTALKKYFGYNPNSRLVRFSHGAYSMDEWLAMIYRELSEGRPVLMGGRYKGTKGEANHIFVADGYDEDGKVHLNLGHANIGFNKDTYYDLTRDDETYTREMRMIVGISPQTLPAELTTIHVSTPGTLVEKSGGKSESRKICRLKVSGTLNPTDVAWLKELAQSTTGQLSYLDLSDCDIQGNSLPESAFDGCLALQEIILPNSLEIRLGSWQSLPASIIPTYLVPTEATSTATTSRPVVNTTAGCTALISGGHTAQACSPRTQISGFIRP